MKKEEAIELYKSEFWESMSYRDIALYQLFTDRLCMPFEVFHKAIEKTLGRPVFTHEFGFNIEGLKKEIMGQKPPPTFQEVIELIPKDKRVIIMEG